MSDHSALFFLNRFRACPISDKSFQFFGELLNLATCRRRLRAVQATVISYRQKLPQIALKFFKRVGGGHD